MGFACHNQSRDSRLSFLHRSKAPTIDRAASAPSRRHDLCHRPVQGAHASMRWPDRWSSHPARDRGVSLVLPTARQG